MKKLKYTPAQKRRASTKLALGISEQEAAETLLEKKLYREALVHMYFTCFYVSQALLVQYLRANPSHKTVNSELHRRYGRRKGFPRSYVKLHTSLKNLRIDYNYRTSLVPSPSLLQGKQRVLNKYVKLALKIVPRVEITDIIRGLYEDNRNAIEDFSYDIYCPKTYAHHTRITLWQPPFYLGIFSPHDMQKHARVLLRALRVRRSGDYVVGMNSRLNQYKETQLIMVDLDSVDAEVEAALKKHRGVLLKSGRGFHFIGQHLVHSEKEWRSVMKGFLRDKALKPYVDPDHLDFSLRRGYATLRITPSPVKPHQPFFYKEF